MPSQRTYYELLGVPPTASTEEIKRAYRQLVKTLHPDVAKRDGIVENVTARFQELQQAYETLIDTRRRQFYDMQLDAERVRTMRRTAFTLRLTSSHPHLQLLNEPQLIYVLAEIKSAILQKSARPTLNLCLVLDRSLSMDGARWQQAKEAAFYLVDQLQSNDILSVIAFSDRARPVVRGQVGADRTVAKTNVRNLQPNGGTELLQGVNAGLDELRKWRSANTLDHMILLTDGQTYGDEDGCLAAADAAASEKIGMTLLGLGADWNEKLLDEMAARGGGFSTFIDAPSKLVTVFKERFAELTNVLARDMQLIAHLNEQAQLKDVFRVTPDIARVQVKDNVIPLGLLEHDRPIRLLLELLVTGKTLGAQRILHAEASGELLNGSGERESVSDETSIEFTDSARLDDSVPHAIEDLLARLAVFKVQEKAMAEAERGEHVRATTRLQNLATHLLNFGEIELARAALLEAGELTRTGHLSDEGRKRIRYGTRRLSQNAALNQDAP